MRTTPSSALTTLLSERAEGIERARRLPDDVVAAIRNEGLFRLWVPTAYDGPEVDALDGLAAIADLAEADGASAWCVMIAMTTSLTAYLLPPDHAKDMFGDPSAVSGGFAAPVGRAVVGPNGSLRVSGRWAWGSGTSHCTVIGGGAIVVDEAGQPAPLPDGTAAPFVFFDRDDVELLDTWHVAGLAGTGSTDYRVEDAIVPAGRWVQFGHTASTIDRPLSRFPMFGLLALGCAAVTIGLARRAVAATVDLAVAKRPQGSGKTLAERQTTQQEVARAEAVVRSSWALLAQTVGDAWATAAAGDPLSIEQRRLLRLAATDAVTRCADATGRMHRLAGGADVYLSSPIQRAFRDAHVASQHAMTAERTYELAGRIRLGLPTDPGQL